MVSQQELGFDALQRVPVPISLFSEARRWQSMDGAMFKAPLAQEQVGPNPTDRKNGSKRHLLVDGCGVPSSFIVTGANWHGVTQLVAVLSAIMVKRETPPKRRSKHLCLGAG